jgi:hypothetical protein
VERHIRPEPDDKEKRPVFTCNSVIPKPAVLEGTQSGSEASVGIAALVGSVITIDFTRERWLPPEVIAGWAPYRHAELARQWLAENKPQALEEGRKCLAAVAETGYPDWFEWCTANWGTKWGTYDFAERERSDGRYVFKFESAWSFPEPVFRKLAEMHPSLAFDVIAYDEGSNFGCEGQFGGRNDYRCAQELATDALYERVYGRKPPSDEDE